MNAAQEWDLFVLLFLVGLTGFVICCVLAEVFTRRTRYFWRMKSDHDRLIPQLRRRDKIEKRS